MAAVGELSFIGLGGMGGPMVSRLLVAGYRVTVTDLNPQVVKAAVAEGATAVASARAAADASEIVMLSLPTPDIVQAVAMGAEGVAGSRSKILVDLSTTGPTVTRRISAALAACGIAYVDAPVSGGVAGAIEGSLAVMCSGDPAAVKAVEPMLKVIGSRIFNLGCEPGLGQVAKLANNLLAATFLAATMEAVAFGVRGGVDPKQLIDIINCSTGRSFVSEVVVPRAVLNESFSIGVPTEMMHKDVKLCLAEAEAVNVPMWLGSATGQFYKFAMSQGYARADVTSLAKIFGNWANIRYRLD
jgi:3-hydroxyisobutyrate dehydrogenase-like beta-hydroxyacid dehydrogenase